MSLDPDVFNVISEKMAALQRDLFSCFTVLPGGGEDEEGHVTLCYMLGYVSLMCTMPLGSQVLDEKQTDVEHTCGQTHEV